MTANDLDADIAEEGRQWEADHPDGVISAEEQEAMDRYGAEACRDEGH